MLKIKVGSFEVLVERGFLGIGLGRRQLWWQRGDGLHLDRLPDWVRSTGF
ncbi:MAG TPA: hypothetical protein VHY19_03420 [Steroidobacteraceae bacterium]|jgi:hypothetical protein|nr:hypothetical protein [Steroidobacteraceae bacterium]